jgi:hydroxymethylglutaryl-CoA lyase
MRIPSEPSVEIVEVGPRDGYQGIAPFIPTDVKIGFIERLASVGLRRIEIGSFVSEKALPQLRDTREVLTACARIPSVAPQVLVPNRRRGEEAVNAGAKALVFVLSVSESHNRENVQTTSEQSVGEYSRLLNAIPSEVTMRLDLATAFDCPFEGRVQIASTMAMLERLVPLHPQAEICLCDTMGRADPNHVESLFSACVSRFPDVSPWALHAHDTYGLGLANVHAAYKQGVRTFDASFGGLGGCPFAPGATGNVATEDIVYMFESMGMATGIDLEALMAVARDAAALPGGLPGGRVRAAMTAKAQMQVRSLSSRV